MRCAQCFSKGKHGPLCKSTYIESDDIFIGRGTGTLSKWSVFFSYSIIDCIVTEVYIFFSVPCRLILLSQAHRKFSIALHYRGLFSEETGQKLTQQGEGFHYRSELTLTAGNEDKILYTNEGDYEQLN